MLSNEKSDTGSRGRRASIALLWTSMVAFNGLKIARLMQSDGDNSIPWGKISSRTTQTSSVVRRWSRRTVALVELSLTASSQDWKAGSAPDLIGRRSLLIVKRLQRWDERTEELKISALFPPGTTGAT